MVRRNYLGAAEQRVGEVKRCLEDLQGRHLQLTVRATLLALLLRMRQEIAAHWRRCGGDPDHGRLLEERAKALLQTGVATNSGGLEGRFEHLRPGASLLQLESVALSRVEEIQRMTLAEAGAEATEWHRLARGAAALLDSPGDAGPEELAAARAAVSATGRRLQELRYLLMIWNKPVYHAFITCRFDTLEPVMTEALDAPVTQWDAVVRGMALFREQALLQIDNGRLLRQRTARVRAERGLLLQGLSALDKQQIRSAAGQLGGGAAGSTAEGQQQPPAGSSGDDAPASSGSGGLSRSGLSSAGGASLSGVFTHEEVIDCLEDNTISEGALRMESVMLAYALLTPLQAGRLVCASFPFPGHHFLMLDAASHMLLHHPEELPWAGSPMHMGDLDHWVVPSGSPTRRH